MTRSDHNCPTKGAYFAMICLLKKCVKFCIIFINSNLILVGYNTVKLSESLTYTFQLLDSWTWRCPTFKQSNMHCTIIGQLDIHCPTIGKLDTHCWTIRPLNMHCQIRQLDIYCPTIGQLNIWFWFFFFNRQTLERKIARHYPSCKYFDGLCRIFKNNSVR